MNKSQVSLDWLGGTRDEDIVDTESKLGVLLLTKTPFMNHGDMLKLYTRSYTNNEIIINFKRSSRTRNELSSYYLIKLNFPPGLIDEYNFPPGLVNEIKFIKKKKLRMISCYARLPRDVSIEELHRYRIIICTEDIY